MNVKGKGDVTNMFPSCFAHFVAIKIRMRICLYDKLFFFLDEPNVYIIFFFSFFFVSVHQVISWPLLIYSFSISLLVKQNKGVKLIPSVEPAHGNFQHEVHGAVDTSERPLIILKQKINLREITKTS